MNKNKNTSALTVIRGLRCDTPGCGYYQDHPAMTLVGPKNYTEYRACIGMPCPKCGASLLTEADYKTVRRLLWMCAVLNVIFWPLSLFRKPDAAMETVDLGMNGSGSINPKHVQK